MSHWIALTIAIATPLLWLARYGRLQRMDGRYVTWGKPEYLISIPCTLARHEVWSPMTDSIEWRRLRLQIGFGQLPIPGFHFRAGIQ